MTRNSDIQPWTITESIRLARTARSRWLSGGFKEAADRHPKLRGDTPDPLETIGLHIGW